MRMRFWIFLISMILAGCSSHAPAPGGHLSDSIVVVAKLNEQLRQWEGTPYRNGGLDQGGVDCSGFVYRTFRDRFDMQLPRTTVAQTTLGTKVSRDDLMPGDLVFFKTGSGQNGLHVGIYDTNDEFIHASTSKGVIRSSLENVYWKRVYWQARRI
ncbi:NlpC/P60 family protein [Yersinia bercovieri]|uniref:NlpC/P60 family protein n=1 Tax=Yersinia bercovieri TaxID=634 RepID=UPI003FD8B26A